MAAVTVVNVPGDGRKSGAIRHGYTFSVVPFWFRPVYRFVADLAVPSPQCRKSCEVFRVKRQLLL